ncbi:hypothetical protein FB451DRAFT_1378574, partial [Mycena latifolia]
MSAGKICRYIHLNLRKILRKPRKMSRKMRVGLQGLILSPFPGLWVSQALRHKLEHALQGLVLSLPGTTGLRHNLERASGFKVSSSTFPGLPVSQALRHNSERSLFGRPFWSSRYTRHRGDTYTSLLPKNLMLPRILGAWARRSRRSKLIAAPSARCSDANFGHLAHPFFTQLDSPWPPPRPAQPRRRHDATPSRFAMPTRCRRIAATLCSGSAALIDTSQRHPLPFLPFHHYLDLNSRHADAAGVVRAVARAPRPPCPRLLFVAPLQPHATSRASPAHLQAPNELATDFASSPASGAHAPPHPRALVVATRHGTRPVSPREIATDSASSRQLADYAPSRPPSDNPLRPSRPAPPRVPGLRAAFQTSVAGAGVGKRYRPPRQNVPVPQLRPVQDGVQPQRVPWHFRQTNTGSIIVMSRVRRRGGCMIRTGQSLLLSAVQNAGAGAADTPQPSSPTHCFCARRARAAPRGFHGAHGPGRGERRGHVVWAERGGGGLLVQTGIAVLGGRCKLLRPQSYILLLPASPLLAPFLLSGHAADSFRERFLILYITVPSFYLSSLPSFSFIPSYSPPLPLPSPSSCPVAAAADIAVIDVGDWGRTLVDTFPACGLGVSVAIDGTLYQTQVFPVSHSPAAPAALHQSSASGAQSCSSHGHGHARSPESSTHGHGYLSYESGDEGVGDPPVLLLGIWLGLDGVNPVSHGTIKLLCTFSQSVGIAGGRPLLFILLRRRAGRGIAEPRAALRGRGIDEPRVRARAGNTPRTEDGVVCSAAPTTVGSSATITPDAPPPRRRRTLRG